MLGRKGADGKPRKSSFGPWMMKAFRLLAALQAPARHAARRVRLFARSGAWNGACSPNMRATSTLIERSLTPGKIEAAAALASVPALIRGYGHVKQANARQGGRTSAARLAASASTQPVLQAAELTDTARLPDRRPCLLASAASS